MDFLFGASEKAAEPAHSGSRQRSWTVREFSAVRLVAREAGAPANQHPAALDPEALRQQLAQVRFDVAGGSQALFAADELAEIISPLVEAFANAGPDDDLLLLSSSRRGGGIFVQPFAVTARLFVLGSRVNLIVNDARFEFYNEYRGSGRVPQFSFGSRAKAGSVTLRSTGATSQRSDWLVLSDAAPAAAPAARTAPPAALPAPTVAAPSPAQPAQPALRPRDPGYADEIEQRLLTLKRLRERNLISEEEYQQKRREILQAL
ncbi:MAG: SHOCT domain-containing protein [Proteobacteria bacterium]|nr:SHOCT domain-containing protein [Pseudomonadota bacterium]